MLMDILFVVPYVPNLVRTRPYNLIRALTDRGNRVTVLTVWTSDEDRQDLAALREIVHEVTAVSLPAWKSVVNCLPALLSGAPLQTSFSWDAKLVSRFTAHSPFDVIHVEHLRGARYALYLKKHTNVPVVWDSVDCITHLFRQAATQSKSLVGRWRSRFELGRTERYEGMLLDKFDHILVTSRLDKDALQSLRPEVPAPISVIPNGVNLDYFKLDTAVSRHPHTLIVTGKMSYHANMSMVLHLAQNIMPLVWQQRPEVQLLVVGKDPGRDIQALAENPNVIVTGTVDALPPYLQQATAAVAPITYGAGIQNKILEAMSCGTPVVTTPHAVSALAIEPGRDLLVADSPTAYAQAILAILADPQLQDRLGRNGRIYVEQHHHWPNVAARLETVYAEAIAAIARKNLHPASSQQ